PPVQNRPATAPSPNTGPGQATHSREGVQRPRRPANKSLINAPVIPAGARLPGVPDVLVKEKSTRGERQASVSYDDYDEESLRGDQDGIRARSEQAIGELAQALIESPTVHNAIAAAFGAREKAMEAQQAALSALNLPSASEVERLERRLRSFSQRLEDVEEQLDEANREIGSLRRQLAKKPKSPPATTNTN